MQAANKSIVIIYHYIQHASQKPRMKGLLIENFEKQVKLLLENNYKIITLGQFAGFYEKSPEFSQKYAIFTFDDGLKDHFVNVLPVFRKYGIAGTFFVLTKPLEEKWLAPVHQLHLVLAAASIEDVKKELDDWLAKNQQVAEGVDNKEIFGQAKKFYLWDDPTTGYVKYLLNMRLEEPIRFRAIGHLFKIFGSSFKEASASFYLNADDLKKMRSIGMEIGSHSYSHPRLASLSEKDQEKEISLSKNILEKILGEKINFFSYPYGTQDSFSDTTINFLKKYGYRGAVTTDQDYIFNSPHQFSLNRIDTNEVNKFIP